MEEKLPKRIEQPVTQSKNLLCEGNLLCHNYYMHYVNNPITKAK